MLIDSSRPLEEQSHWPHCPAYCWGRGDSGVQYYPAQAVHEPPPDSLQHLEPGVDYGFGDHGS